MAGPPCATAVQLLGEARAQHDDARAPLVVHVGDGHAARELEGAHLEVGRRHADNAAQNADVPVIMLTAKGEDVDRIVGLELRPAESLR